MEPYFFLSYARADDDGATIARFHGDLSSELARLDPDAGGVPSFRDLERILLGADWEQVLARAVAGCRAMVSLYSPAYFTSVYCGKEWTAFHSRVVVFQQETGWDCRALLPVLWRPLPGGPPPPADAVQYLEPSLGERYAEVGLQRLLQEDPDGPEYRQVIEVLAARLRLAAGRARLPGISGLDLREVAEVFPQRLASALPVTPPFRAEPVVPAQLFLSYAPADRMWAEWAATALSALGYRTSLHGVGPDGADAPPTDEAVSEVGWALAGQGRVLALLTPDYLRYPRAAAVWRALAGHDCAPGVPSLVPLRIGESDRALPRLFAERPAVDLAGTDAADSAARLAAAVGHPQGPTAGASATAAAGYPGELPNVMDCPARNTAFTGRDHELEALRDGFPAAGGIQAITGLGGVGKTQTAVEYAHRFRAGYDVIWWIAAEQTEFIAPRLAALAPSLGLESPDDSRDTAARVVAALRRGEPYRRWLLILDNAGDPEQMERWLPDGGHVLVTSRDSGWSRRAAQIDLSTFQRSESVRLLRRLNPHLTAGHARNVAEQLGDLPLAIAQAASWLRESGMPVSGYLDLLRATLTELLERTRLPEADYPRSVAATWQLTLQELRQRNARAAELLEICAHFGPEPIPTPLLFSPMLARRLGLGPDEGTAQLELGELVRVIHRTGLARADSGRQSLTVHRLVQAVVRDQVPPERRAELRRTAHLALAAAAPPEPDVVDNWDAFAELLPHLAPSAATGATDPRVRRLIINSVRYLWKRGLYPEARELAERTLERWAAAGSEGGRLPDDDLHTGMLRVQLANVLRDQNEYAASYAIDRAAVERFRRDLGPRHLETLIAASNLGADLRGLGRFQEALELDRATLETAREALGPRHERTGMTMYNLAGAETLADNWQPALDLYRQALRLQRRPGPASLNTLLTMVGYATALRGLGRLRESQALLEEAVHTYRRSVSDRHWQSSFARAQLAATYYQLGDYQQARTLGEEAHRVLEEVQGPGHGDTLVAAAGLAAALIAQGELEPARLLASRSHRMAQESFGEEHPQTFVLAANLAIALGVTGSPGEGGALLEAAASGLSTSLGPEHSTLGAVLTAGATALAQAGDADRAAKLSCRAVGILGTVFGPAHPNSLIARSNLALDLAATGRPDQASELRGRCARDAAAALGPDHPIALAAAEAVRMVGHVEPLGL